MPAEADSPKAQISLVIATRDRAAQLQDSLQAIARIQCSTPWEVVIVDNGSTDATAEVVANAGRTLPCRVVFLSEPRPGASRARNLGWRSAQGSVIAFIDDDCHPDPAFLDAALEVLGESASLGYAGGRIRLADATDYPITVRDSPDRVDLPGGAFVPTGLIQGANLTCRRSALESVGGYDARVGAGTRFPGEDVDLAARMSAAGWRGAYDPRPLVSHRHGRKTAEEASRLMKYYDRGRGAYYLKCLLDPRLRGTYLRHWWGAIRSRPIGASARELLGAAEFALRGILPAGGPGGPTG